MGAEALELEEGARLLPLPEALPETEGSVEQGLGEWAWVSA